MKRDMNLIHLILMAIENGDNPEEIPGEIDRYTKDQVLAHCELATEAGLLAANSGTGKTDHAHPAKERRLSWAGHDFLDAHKGGDYRVVPILRIRREILDELTEGERAEIRDLDPGNLRRIIVDSPDVVRDFLETPPRDRRRLYKDQFQSLATIAAAGLFVCNYAETAVRALDSFPAPDKPGTVFPLDAMLWFEELREALRSVEIF